MAESLGWHVFTEKARRAFYFAREEASLNGSTSLMTVHLMIGLITDEDNVARRVLSMMGITPECVGIELRKSLQPATGDIAKCEVLSDEGVRAVKLAYEEARLLSNTYIGTEHLFLGLIREGSGPVGTVCAKLNISLERTRKIIQSLQDT